MRYINDLSSSKWFKGYIPTYSECYWSKMAVLVIGIHVCMSVSKINKALSVTYKLLFIFSKNIVPSRSYRYLNMDVYIRDRAFPMTCLPPLY